MRRRDFLTVATSALAAAACAPAATPPNSAQLSKAPSVTFTERGIDTVASASGDLVTHTRSLGAEILHTALRDKTFPNYVTAPWSTMSTLLALRAGATDATAGALDTALGPYHPAAAAALIGQLEVIAGDPGSVSGPTPPPVPLYHQNSGLFIRQSHPVRQPFLDEISRYFNIGVYPIGFGTAQAARAIDEWFAVNTAGAVERSASDIPANAALAAFATAFFAASWDAPFDPSATQLAPFTTESGRIANVSMMTSSAAHATARGPGFTAIALPYAGAGTVLHVIVPEPGNTIAALANSTMLESAANLLHTSSRPAPVLIPRWQTTTNSDISTALRANGLDPLFHGGLDAIADDASLTIACVATQIGAAELGTTAKQSDPASTPAPRISRNATTVDRPFIYEIRDTATGLSLAMGIVRDPSTR